MQSCVSRQCPRHLQACIEPPGSESIPRLLASGLDLAQRFVFTDPERRQAAERPAKCNAAFLHLDIKVSGTFLFQTRLNGLQVHVFGFRCFVTGGTYPALRDWLPGAGIALHIDTYTAP